MFIIYEIRNNQTGDTYVGCCLSHTYGARKAYHQQALRKDGHHNDRLQAAFNFSQRDEGSFSFNVLEELNDGDYAVAREREQYWIEKQGTYNKRAAAARLSEDDVLNIYQEHLTGVPVKTLAGRYGVSASAIYALLEGRTWKSTYEKFCQEHADLLNGKEELTEGRKVLIAQVDSEFHRLVRIEVARRGLNLSDVVRSSVAKELGLEYAKKEVV